MRPFVRWFSVIVVATAVLAGCGDDSADGGDAAPPPPADAPAGDPPADPPADPEGSDDDDGDDGAATPPAGGPGAAGVVVIDGVARPVDSVVRCDPTLDILADSLDLIGLGEGFQVFVYSDDVMAVRHMVDYQGPEGLFTNVYIRMLGSWSSDFGGERDTPPIEIDGDRVRVEMILHEAIDEVDTVEAVIEMVIPAEPTDCG